MPRWKDHIQMLQWLRQAEGLRCLAELILWKQRISIFRLPRSTYITRPLAPLSGVSSG